MLTTSADTQTIALLRQLVQIESINPSLSPDGSGERAVAEFLETFCTEQGLAYELQDVAGGRPNFLTWVLGEDAETRLLFVAHMDTVPVDAGQWESDPFSGHEQGGRLYGRGSCDTKGSLAAMLIALSTLDRQPRATVVVAASIDEEFRKLGARTIAQSGVAYDAAVVGEPTELEVVVAHMGSVRWQVEVQGVPAHTSMPHLGVNAITGMAKVVLALDELNRDLTQRTHPLVGNSAITVSLIEGGIELTTVPPSCRIWIDRRLIPGERPGEAIQEVEGVLETLRQREGIQVRSLLPALEDPAPQSAESSRIAAVAARVCAEVAGTGDFKGMPGGTDASQLAPAGIPCVVIGPGSSRQAHTNGEFIELTHLPKAVDIYRRIMLSY